MLWGELRGARGLDRGPLPRPAVHKKMGETGAPLMLRYLNWQCSPVLSVWYSSPSIQAALTESMAYDSKITGLCFWPSIVILCSLSLSVSQYQSQLGPLAVHFINKHDRPEVHAQLFIMWVSQSEKFRHWSDLKFLGEVLIMGKFSFCDYVKPHGESRNVGSRNVAEFCACGVKKQTKKNHGCCCVCVFEGVRGDESYLTADTHEKTSGPLAKVESRRYLDNTCHRSQFNLHCPVMKSRFMLLISYCNFCTSRQQNHVLKNGFHRTDGSEL